MAGDVDLEVAEDEPVALRLAVDVRAPQQRANARDELARRERLDEVVVGAELETGDAVLFLALGGEHDDRHVGGVADRAADLLAARPSEA